MYIYADIVDTIMYKVKLNAFFKKYWIDIAHISFTIDLHIGIKSFRIKSTWAVVMDSIAYTYIIDLDVRNLVTCTVFLL